MSSTSVACTAPGRATSPCITNTGLPHFRPIAISDSVPMLPPMATRHTPLRAMMPLRISPMPVGMATLSHSLAWRSSSSGRMPTAMPPASTAPREAAAITPPRPPQTTAMPAPASACATA
ncbi:hypothetical protein D3C87_1095280 [compost metagenome]